MSLRQVVDLITSIPTFVNVCSLKRWSESSGLVNACENASTATRSAASSGSAALVRTGSANSPG